MDKTKCINCGNECTLGKDAITTDDGTKCDSCSSIVRGIDGAAFDNKPSCCCYEYEGDNPRCKIHGGAA